MGEEIKVNCISGDEWIGIKLDNTMQLPKNSKLYKTGQEYKNGMFGKTFHLYKKKFKNKNKFYIIFSKYF